MPEQARGLGVRRGSRYEGARPICIKHGEGENSRAGVIWATFCLRGRSGGKRACFSGAPGRGPGPVPGRRLPFRTPCYARCPGVSGTLCGPSPLWGAHRELHRPGACGSARPAAHPRRSGLRRLSDGDRLPRHHLHGAGQRPRAGTESWARGMGSSPGGVANMATALARLGLRTSLAAAFGDDHYGEYCWDSLEQGEGIDLTSSRTVAGWHSPVTVSMAYEGERTMVSHGHEPPPEEPAPSARRRHAPPSRRWPPGRASPGSPRPRTAGRGSSVTWDGTTRAAGT